MPGLDAILFILRHGEKFTDEMRKTQQLFFDWFGPGVEDYTYLLITHCRSNVEAKQYIEEKPHKSLQDLVRKCGNRVLSLENHGVNVSHQTREIIDKLMCRKAGNNEKSYTDVKYRTIEHIAKTRDLDETSHESLDIMKTVVPDIRRFMESQSSALIKGNTSSDNLYSIRYLEEEPTYKIRIYNVSSSEPDKFEIVQTETDTENSLHQTPRDDRDKWNRNSHMSGCSDEEKETSSLSKKENVEKICSATVLTGPSNKPDEEDNSADSSGSHSSEEEQGKVDTGSDEVQYIENKIVDKTSTDSTFCKEGNKSGYDLNKIDSRQPNVSFQEYRNNNDIRYPSDSISKEVKHYKRKSIRHGKTADSAESYKGNSIAIADLDKTKAFRKKMDEDSYAFSKFYKKVVKALKKECEKLCTGSLGLHDGK